MHPERNQQSGIPEVLIELLEGEIPKDTVSGLAYIRAHLQEMATTQGPLATRIAQLMYTAQSPEDALGIGRAAYLTWRALSYHQIGIEHQAAIERRNYYTKQISQLINHEIGHRLDDDVHLGDLRGWVSPSIYYRCTPEWTACIKGLPAKGHRVAVSRVLYRASRLGISTLGQLRAMPLAELTQIRLGRSRFTTRTAEFLCNMFEKSPRDVKTR